MPSWSLLYDVAPGIIAVLLMGMAFGDHLPCSEAVVMPPLDVGVTEQGR
jgi:hypothetical protein